MNILAPWKLPTLSELDSQETVALWTDARPVRIMEGCHYDYTEINEFKYLRGRKEGSRRL